MFLQKFFKNIDVFAKIHGNVFLWKPNIMGNKSFFYWFIFQISAPWLHLFSHNACPRYLNSRRDLLYRKERITVFFLISAPGAFKIEKKILSFYPLISAPIWFASTLLSYVIYNKCFFRYQKCKINFFYLFLVQAFIKTLKQALSFHLQKLLASSTSLK